MANKIELITKYSQDAFDETYRADSRIGLVDGNTKDMVFVGAKTVKIPKWTGGGMYDYKRANAETSGRFSNGTKIGEGYGYQQSDMGYEWETFTIAIDRAVQYRVDLFDDEETAKTLVARGSTQVNKQILIPEIDAYAFAKIASAASATLGNLENTNLIDETTGAGHISPVEALNDGLLWMEEHEVPEEDQLIYCSPRFVKSLRNTSKNGLVKPLLQGEFEKNVKFTIEEYEGRKITSVPPARFFTNMVFGAGLYHRASESDVGKKWGEGNHAYVISGASEDIDFMIVQKSAIYHIVKYNKIKVFGPDVVQDYDGYKINVHVYHDVFVPDNKRVAIYVKTGGFAQSAAANYAKVIYAAQTAGTGSAGDANFFGLGVLPGSVMVDEYCIVAKANVPALGATKPVSNIVTVYNGSTVLGANIATGLSNGADAYLVAIKNGIVVGLSDEFKLKAKAA